MERIEFRSITRFTAWPLWSGLALLALTGAALAQFYAVTDLGTLGGTNCIAYGINNHEQIVGTAQTAMGNYHAFMFDGGRMMDLGTLGGSNSWAHGINDSGWMVGAAGLAGTDMHAFLCTNGLMGPVMMDLGTLGGSNSAEWMITMHGEMGGWAAMSNGSHHAFFMTNWMSGGMMDLGTAGGTNSEAYCINSNRMVVGCARMSDGSVEPIMSTNAMYGSGSMMRMGMGGMGASGGQSWFVNELGNTAGQAQMSGGNHHAYTDFGIARVADTRQTRTGVVMGSPSYMSPEQLAGQRVDGRSDLFALGVTAFELLTGRQPFDGETLAALTYQIANAPHPDPVKLRRALPGCLRAVFDKALAKDPEQRYQTGTEFSAGLRDCLTTTTNKKRRSTGVA